MLDRLGPFPGGLDQPGPVLGGEGFPAVQLPPQPGRAEGHAGDGVDLAGIPDPRLQAPAPEVESEDRVAAHPHAGPLADEAEAGLLLAGQQGDRAADDPFEPAEELHPVVGVPEGGGGQRHHHVDPRLIGGGPEPAHGPHRGGRPVGGNPTGPGHFGPQMEERPATEHRGQRPGPGRIHHHQVEGATPEIEHGHPHSRHRRDAIGPVRPATGSRPWWDAGTLRTRSDGHRIDLGRTGSNDEVRSVILEQPHREVAQLGSAPALGAGGRGFKSPLPDTKTLVRALDPPGKMSHRRPAVATR